MFVGRVCVCVCARTRGKQNYSLDVPRTFVSLLHPAQQYVVGMIPQGSVERSLFLFVQSVQLP